MSVPSNSLVRPVEEVDPEFYSLLKSVVENNKSGKQLVRLSGSGGVFVWRGYWSEIVGERIEPGRNDPCICGSNKKFKKCCGK